MKPTPKTADDLIESASSDDRLGLVRGGEGIITGTVVCAAVIAAGAGHIDSTAGLTIAIIGTVFVYWLAHLHAHTIGHSVANGMHPLSALRGGISHTWPIAAASLLPIGILLVAEVAGAEIRTAAWIALCATIVLLAAYSYLAGRRSGLGTGSSLLSAAAGAALGIIIVLMKATLH